MKKLTCTLFAVLATGVIATFAQDTAKGKITITVDEKVNEYIDQRRQENINDSLSKGFRIQIIVSQKRNDAKIAKEKFSNMYPNCPVYLTFDSPYFKVRVGDYKTKLEAQALLFKLTQDFPTLILIEDKINPPPVEPCY